MNIYFGLPYLLLECVSHSSLIPFHRPWLWSLLNCTLLLAHSNYWFCCTAIPWMERLLIDSKVKEKPAILSTSEWMSAIQHNMRGRVSWLPKIATTTPQLLQMGNTHSDSENRSSNRDRVKLWYQFWQQCQLFQMVRDELRRTTHLLSKRPESLKADLERVKNRGTGVWLSFILLCICGGNKLLFFIR